VHVLSYCPLRKNCFHLAISFKFVAPVALLERRELTIKNKRQITETYNCNQCRLCGYEIVRHGNLFSGRFLG